MPFSDRVSAWEAAGERVEVGGHRVHVVRRGGDGPATVLLHGFPSSSFDFAPLLEAAPGLDALTFDFLGFGLSDKPARHGYSIFGQADIAQLLVARHFDGPVFLVAHDMGTSVATELLARDLEGVLPIELAGVLLFNGSIVLAAASPTIGQRLLRGPLGPALSRLGNEAFFRRQLGSVFSPGHPLAAADAAEQWTLLRNRGGHRIGHRLVSYMDERERHAGRWHGAVRDWPGVLSFAWGMRDPVATPAVLAALRELRPQAPVTELADLGHYPQLEDPERMAAIVTAAAEAPSRGGAAA